MARKSYKESDGVFNRTVTMFSGPDALKEMRRITYERGSRRPDGWWGGGSEEIPDWIKIALEAIDKGTLAMPDSLARIKTNRHGDPVGVRQARDLMELRDTLKALDTLEGRTRDLCNRAIGAGRSLMLCEVRATSPAAAKKLGFDGGRCESTTARSTASEGLDPEIWEAVRAYRRQNPNHTFKAAFEHVAKSMRLRSRNGLLTWQTVKGAYYRVERARSNEDL